MSALWALFNVGKVLRFLASPAGKFLAVMVLILVWTVYHRVDARRDCEEEELSRKLEIARQQALTAGEIAKEALERADASEAEMGQLERDNAQLKQDVKDGKVDTCSVPDDVRDRLLRIR